jgi:MoaA/NifB/PqqE/SkfB family radical SAM enzyme/SAM-dependent methyltransferase
MTIRQMAEWQRIEYESTPIYIRPEVPDWFVPNEAADQALAKLWSREEICPEVENLLKRLDRPAAPKYESRSDQLRLNGLKECWLHVTNRCNMACKHCMFTSSPRARDELAPADLERVIREAYELGCRLFFFTGGEPFLSESFLKSLQDVLPLANTHVVVLTNLSLISRTKDQIHAHPRDRLHFQISLDGLESNHDALRGPRAFEQLKKDLGTLKELGFPVTLATTITRHNVEEMEQIIDLAAEHEISNVHFLWLFRKGNADDSLFLPPNRIFFHLSAAQERAEKAGVRIDNVEILHSQVFSCPGTRYDLSNAGWQSIAVGPDGHVYPTPALIYTKDMQCGHIRAGLKEIWEKSPVLKTVREASLNDSRTYRVNPLRYIIGGGDMDHSYIHSGKITGGDPYVGLYANIAKWLIAREAKDYPTSGYPAIRLKMGEKLGECPVEGGTVFFTHSNCVLSLPGQDTRSQVNQFYTEAAEETKEDILNPICYEEALVRHIPAEMRFRSYGCGSPVLEAQVQPGETVVDLGSGTGIECFIASKLTGPRGRVTGIDMGDAMLAVANKTRGSVVKNLGYDNLEFKKAYLEDLPLDQRSVDLVISNCVLNLSPDKRKVFREIQRVLKPKGRLVVSDITYDKEIPLEIKYNEKLRGECIGGALRYHDLFGLLNDLGFSESEIIKGFHYRTVKGYDFYSITYRAFKPPEEEPPVLYNFPSFGRVMAAVETQPTCTCFVAPQEGPQERLSNKEAHPSGCMVCGEELHYFETHQDKACHYCGQVLPANAQCAHGHFVCDACHRADAVEIIKQVCLHSEASDAVALMEAIRSHSRFPVHGPEHHALVPAVILTALRNAGNQVTDEQIITAIQRGQTIAGGACAFLGACGAAVGVGTAFSVLLGANPYDGDKRQTVQQVTQEVLEKIASYKAPRCCQRDCWLALKEASRLLKERLGIALSVNDAVTCKQFPNNKECIHDRCPFWPRKQS